MQIIELPKKWPLQSVIESAQIEIEIADQDSG